MRQVVWKDVMMFLNDLLRQATAEPQSWAVKVAHNSPLVFAVEAIAVSQAQASGTRAEALARASLPADFASGWRWLALQMRLVRRTHQEAATWGVAKWGLSDASASADLSLGFRGEATHRQLLRTAAFCQLLLLCVLHPVSLRPVLWHGKGDAGCKHADYGTCAWHTRRPPQISRRCAAYGRLGRRKHPCLAKCWWLHSRRPQARKYLVARRSQLQD